MVLVIGAVLSLQLAGLRVYQHTASADWASFDAGQAVERLEDDIRNCYRVTGRYDDRITVSRPLTAYDSIAGGYFPVQPLEEGQSVRYYLSDDSGALGLSGTYLWRAERAAGGSIYVLNPAPLADNITALEFTYELAPAPRDASTRYVNLRIEALVREGGTTTTRSHSARILCRNWEYGPITAETGIDEEE